jgi:hypothetical protein
MSMNKDASLFKFKVYFPYFIFHLLANIPREETQLRYRNTFYISLYALISICAIMTDVLYC